jgi:hypothetical protein
MFYSYLLLAGTVKIIRKRSAKFYPSFIPGYGDMGSGVSTAAGLKSGQLNRNRNFSGTVPKTAVVGFRIS